MLDIGVYDYILTGIIRGSGIIWRLDDVRRKTACPAWSATSPPHPDKSLHEDFFCGLWFMVYDVWFTVCVCVQDWGGCLVLQVSMIGTTGVQDWGGCLVLQVSMPGTIGVQDWGGCLCTTGRCP